jgi:hypothetical protein
VRAFILYISGLKVAGSACARLLTQPKGFNIFQARPVDYNSTLLGQQDPISFHKFDGHDPLETYSKWFKAADERLLRGLKHKDNCLQP